MLGLGPGMEEMRLERQGGARPQEALPGMWKSWDFILKAGGATEGLSAVGWQDATCIGGSCRDSQAGIGPPRNTARSDGGKPVRDGGKATTEKRGKKLFAAASYWGPSLTPF